MRPTNDRLETIMKDAHLRADDAGVLAAEVRALRDELAAEKREKLSWMSNSAIYCATLERVEALPAKWRADEESALHTCRDGTVCADELAAALKGSP